MKAESGTARRTRTRLLRASLRLFLQQGVAATSLTDIAEAAGYTRGAVHVHFKDKGALLCALGQRLTRAWPPPSIRPGADLWDELLRRTLIPMQRLSREVLCLRLCQVLRAAEHSGTSFDPTDAAMAARRAHIEALTQLIAKLQLLGRLDRSMPATSLALGLHTLVEGLILRCAEGLPPGTARACADQSARALLQAHGSEPVDWPQLPQPSFSARL